MGDNDNSKNKKHFPGVKCFLFLLYDLMESCVPLSLKELVGEMSKTLPFQFLVQLMKQRKTNRKFRDVLMSTTRTKIIDDSFFDECELDIKLPSGLFSQIADTRNSIQLSLRNSKEDFTFMDLFESVDPLTFAIYRAL